MYLFYENKAKTSIKPHSTNCFSMFYKKGYQRASPLKQGLRLSSAEAT